MMMRQLILWISLLVTTASYGQNLFKGENGKLKFFSDALIEDIGATTNKTISALDISTGNVAVIIPIKSFIFRKSLMQEHFNENYMESDKFSDASFRGKIIDKPILKIGENSLVNISGSLTVHGVSQDRNIQLNLKSNADGSVLATGKFEVKVTDHKIKIPSLMFQNIAEVVEVTFELKLKPVLKP
jgi:polyisoprenoid-binding protein YceI